MTKKHIVHSLPETHQLFYLFSIFLDYDLLGNCARNNILNMFVCELSMYILYILFRNLGPSETAKLHVARECEIKVVGPKRSKNIVSWSMHGNIKSRFSVRNL